MREAHRDEEDDEADLQDISDELGTAWFIDDLRSEDNGRMVLGLGFGARFAELGGERVRGRRVRREERDRDISPGSYPLARAASERG